MLLMLDNFEHLITGAGFLADILENAPGVKLLTTSRERLNLRAEWLFEVKGLKYPLDRNLVSWRNRVSTDVEGYSAVQLFVESARRVHSDFRLSEAEKPFVVRVCQMLEGMPLGIELAAAWVRVLSCAEIAEEIEHNLGFLASPLRDVAERHRSLRAVFEHSWNLLSQEERVTFSKLSVFRGGFRREAAERVAGASLFLLMALADKSLLRRDASGRYDILEVLRQYGAEKLKEAPREYETVQDLHCEYYAEFLHQREEHLRGGRQREALAEIADEIENIRTGWHRALEQRNEEAIRRSLNGLYRFYETRSWFQEGETTFKQATTVLSGRVGEISPALPGSPAPRLLILGKVLARQGGFSYRLGLYENARQLLRESLAILRPLEVPEEIAFTLNNLGDIARLLGEYDEAQQLLQESVEIGRQTGDRRRLARALNNLGIVAGSLGQSEEAKQLFQEALALFRELEDQWGITKALNNLGIIAYYLGEYEDARQLYQASLESRREIGDHYGKALALNNLGLVAHDLGEYAEAKRLHLESMAIFKEIGYLLGTALCLKDLGHVACALQEFRVAEKYFREALKTAMAIRAVPVALHALLGLATLRQAEGEKEQALSLVTLTLHHPASDKETRNRAEHLLSELASQLPPQVIATARERGKTAAFEEEVAKILVGKD
jgi:predicted ATPase/Tfp pilus assembly protein PilF